jgi:hypothetical protein
MLTRKGLSPKTEDYILLTRVEEDGYQHSVDPAYEAEPASEEKQSEPSAPKENPVIHWFTKLRQDVDPNEGAPAQEPAPQDDQASPDDSNEKEDTL